ncbi:unnamed protein product [Penicillium salamii]|uniref:Aminotransferase class I/classII large domain-containing protein n=1 Tax=Penicillium salamii TaxID=1612424 RepID=A0A9W4J6V7_9EURO|nr:unnamed protein product [Penicillium salamii]CAG8097787.1 unnamed protein product [Penicillium salamii]CAG8139186.1 unnamed protein product [Penicillium salamii]CAG8193429.1 unnamed protein product [Penicillium salamii]CAG8296664.1 unnamed protein product [Penicillium salamii]
MGNPWSPSNPSGTVILRLAENSLLHDEVVEFFNKQINVQPAEHLTYCTGPRGSRRLRRAVAALLNDDFQSKEIITADNILITPGVASAIDGLAWSICEDGDGILVPQPFYNGFTVDLLNRSNARVVGVTYRDIEGYSDLDDLFNPNVNAKALEAALCRAKSDGITVKALLISNPHTPLGRCYPAETLRVFIRFCAGNQLHFISDEIYAKSLFANPAIPSPVPFISTLSLDYQSLIDPSLVHILYGASKDFCANGIRLGLVCTKNEGIMGAMSSIGIFSWSPHLLQDIWAAMLEDREWLEKFMTKKAELMAENYKIATSFFSDRGINYYDMNAGLFIWVDLRHLFVPNQASQSSGSSGSGVQSSGTTFYQKRELQIADICTKNGVLIAPGSVYVPEELGWFRTTFTLQKVALKEGLERVWKSLKEVEFAQ